MPYGGRLFRFYLGNAAARSLKVRVPERSGVHIRAYIKDCNLYIMTSSQ